MLCEMRSAVSRIWTRIAVSISYDDNHYTTGCVFVFIEILNFKKCKALVMIFCWLVIGYLVWWHINPCEIFSAKFWLFVDIYICIWCNSVSYLEHLFFGGKPLPLWKGCSQYILSATNKTSHLLLKKQFPNKSKLKYPIFIKLSNCGG